MKEQRPTKDDLIIELHDLVAEQQDLIAVLIDTLPEGENKEKVKTAWDRIVMKTNAIKALTEFALSSQSARAE